MLIKLFGSNARAKILKLFLFHSDNKYYIRQVARDLDLQVNSVRRELENLEEFGLLISKVGEDVVEAVDAIEGEGPKIKKKLNQEKKYFRVNKDFALFEDIKSLIIKSQVLSKDDLIKRLKTIGQIKLLILSGIFVNKLDGVVDVFIVGDVDREKVIKVISSIEKELGREINFSLMNVSEFKYRREITDIFLYDILESNKIIAIDELGVN